MKFLKLKLRLFFHVIFSQQGNWRIYSADFTHIIVFFSKTIVQAQPYYRSFWLSLWLWFYYCRWCISQRRKWLVIQWNINFDFIVPWFRFLKFLGKHKIIGDIYCLISSLFYAISNVGTEYFLQSSSKLEYLSMIGFFGTVFSLLQM